MATETSGGWMLKRGYTFDPEDSRMTHRLHRAIEILRSQGIEFTPFHKGYCADKPQDPEHRYVCGSGVGCGVTWPATTTDEVFDAAYRMADAVVRANASALKAAVAT